MMPSALDAGLLVLALLVGVRYVLQRRREKLWSERAYLESLKLAVLEINAAAGKIRADTENFSQRIAHNLQDLHRR
jgi:hypothetical protein